MCKRGRGDTGKCFGEMNQRDKVEKGEQGKQGLKIQVRILLKGIKDTK